MRKRLIPSLWLIWVLISPCFIQAQELRSETEDQATLQDPFTFTFKNGATLKLYGRLDMLTYYDTTSPAISDWLVYVYPKNTIEGGDGSFSMSVRGSPFGFFFTKPKLVGGADLKAKIEMDFVGGFSTGTMGAYSPQMRLREIWFSLDWPHISVLAGQSYGVFGPLFPEVGPWILLGTSGNPWIRLPQLRLTVQQQPVKFELSVNRPMGANELRSDSVDDIISDGERAKLPFMMSRLGYTKSFEGLTLTSGIAGVYGRERVHRQDPAAGISVDTTLNVWLLVYDLLLTSRFVEFRGEGFAGQNLNSFFGGVMQGVSVLAHDAIAIESAGGWGQFTIRPWEKLYFNVGSGIDHPFKRDLASATQRTFNWMIYGNANYKLTPQLKLSFEPSYLRTGYFNDNTNGNFRALFKTSLEF